MINKIQELAKPELITADGRTYSSKQIHPVLAPSPLNLPINTLTGLSDYLKVNTDKLDPEKLMIHVGSFQSVSLLSALSDPWKQRDRYIVAECDTLKFSFGQFMDVESFIIRMQSLFVQDVATANILNIVGNITDGTVTAFDDDGVSQKVTAKAGVSRVKEIPVPNPVTLRPYRTFLEIEQPASKFVFRMRSGEQSPTCALFEADGGTWKNEAMKSIKKWLEENTTGIPVIA